MSVWDELIGQQRAIDVLRRAVEGGAHAMSHAWLIVGPPGSGRSNAARAFAAALECDHNGCGSCNACRTVLSGAHPDVTLMRTEKLSIGIDEAHRLAGRANMEPSVGQYQIVVIEDADRLTPQAADALLKSVEEPSSKTVWLLCAPTADDLPVTIRSRCRELRLVTPSVAAVTQLLVARDGIDEPLAAHCARIAQGHVGRARALARMEDVRARRQRILALPSQLDSLGDCLNAASYVVTSSTEETQRHAKERDAAEMAKLQQDLGLSGSGTNARLARTAMKELEEQQQARAKRAVRDSLDSVLWELTGFYRDVMAVQTAPGVPLVNADIQDQIEAMARSSTPELTVQALDALLEARRALASNVAPLLAMEALMIKLGRAVRH